MPAKMISERPWLRSPNSDINSPSQMANIVPAVMVRIVVTVGKLNPRSKVKMFSPVVVNCWKRRIWPMAFSAAMGTAK